MTTLVPSPLRRYKYEQLLHHDTVRVLRLEPAVDKGQTLRGSLIHLDRYAELVKPGSCQWFSAVSYTWGLPHFSEQLLLKSERDAYDTYLPITENVKIMLQYLRKSYKPQHLWIDAICLNQRDDVEKAKQIPLMGQIYLHAHKVYIWLGHTDEDETSRVFAFLRLIALAPYNWPMTKVFTSDDEGIAQLERFFRQKWFFRRWVLQEAAFARNGVICCGHLQIPYHVFVGACRYLSRTSLGRNINALETTARISDMVRLRDSAEGPQHQRDIYALLWTFHRKSCSQKRDRIAALYGFLPRALQLRVDFTAPYEEIYRQHSVELANTPAQHLLILHLFHFGSIYDEKGSDVASWIPDWSKERSMNLPSYYNPYSENLDSITPDGVTSLFGYSAKRRRSLLQGYWLGQPLGLLTRDFHPSEGIRPPNTFFSTHVDSNRDILTVSWINPWAGQFGRPVTAVVSITKDPSSADGFSDWSTIFQPIAPKIRRDINGSCTTKLRLLIESIMSKSNIWQLGKRDEVERVVECALCRLFGTKCSQRPLLYDAKLEWAGMLLPERLTAVLTELAQILHDSKLCIVELQGDDGACDYALGPSNLEIDMRLIPLASHLTTSELTYNSGRPFVMEDENPRIAWLRNIQGYALTNFLAIKFTADQVQAMSLTRATAIERLCGKSTRQVGPDGHPLVCRLPIKGTYAGACAGVVPYSKMHPPLRGYGRRLAMSRKTMNWIGSMQSDIDNAREEGRPPPYMIDII